MSEESLGVFQIADRAAQVRAAAARGWEGQVSAGNPVRLPIFSPGFDHFAENVGKRLVQRARLVLIEQIRRMLDNPVGQLVAHDVQRSGKRTTIAKYDEIRAGAPERILIVLTITDNRMNRRALTVK